MQLINCDINIILTWSENCVNSEGNRATNFAIIDTKLFVLVVSLSTQDNTTLLQQLKLELRHTINWNKYQSRISLERPNLYLDWSSEYSIDPNFQRVYRLFVLSFENNAHRTIYTGYFFPKVEMKDYNVMIVRQNFCD